MTPREWHQLSLKSPALAGDLAYRRFCTPVLSKFRSSNHSELVARARRHLQTANRRWLDTSEGRVAVYEFLPDDAARRSPDKMKTVLLAHGWTSEASFMTALAEPLRRAGFRVVLFDQPAHGMSPGSETSLIACARAFIEVAEAYAPVHYCVAHSMGCLTAQLAGAGGAPFRKAIPMNGYVFISAPNDFRDVTRKFCRELGLTPAAERYYERHLERVSHRTLDEVSSEVVLPTIARPTLLLHGERDTEIPVSDAHGILAACPDYARLKTFSGLGHRRILYATPIMRETLNFLRGLSLQPATSFATTRNKAAGQHRPMSSGVSSGVSSGIQPDMATALNA